jgi:hypothetical protein
MQAATAHNASIQAYQRYRDAEIINNRELRELAEALFSAMPEKAWLEAVWQQLALDGKLAEPLRPIVQVGWDGASRPMYRYRDELSLPDYQRSIVVR